MKYRLPIAEDKGALQDYVMEHYENGEYSLSAGLELENTEYSEWLSRIQINLTDGNDEWGRSILLLCINDEKIIGLLSIRYELSDELSDKYGDIGYGVRPSERGKGYATEMLKHGLEICRDHGMRSVTLGCYKDNEASAAVIRKCGGNLIVECDNYEKGRMSQYYLIEI